jgi:hypothetical protein
MPTARNYFLNTHYWVKYHDKWEVAFYDGEWWVTASETPIEQIHFDEIGEAVIHNKEQ